MGGGRGSLLQTQKNAHDRVTLKHLQCSESPHISHYPGIENAQTGPIAEVLLELLRRKAWTTWQLKNESRLTAALWGSGPQSLAAESSGRLGNRLLGSSFPDSAVV